MSTTSTTTLYAQPYDITASGFIFTSVETYREKAATLRNDCGLPVEEFEIQFIDGEEIEALLAKAWELTQVNFARFLEVVDEWDEWQKRQFIIAVGECGYAFDRDRHDPMNLEIEIYPADNLREFAETCVEDGWFGEIPQALEHYIDYDAIARDLAVEYSEIEIAGERYVYACR
ncbi:MAG: antirestriction protein ArdA [Devosia sp.]